MGYKAPGPKWVHSKYPATAGLAPLLGTGGWELLTTCLDFFFPPRILYGQDLAGVFLPSEAKATANLGSGQGL